MKQKTYFGDKVHRVKLYKKGKNWVASTITLLSFELLISAPQPVKAARINSKSEEDASVVVVSSSSSSNIQKNVTASSVSSTSQSSTSSSLVNPNSSQVSSSSVSQKQSSSTISQTSSTSLTNTTSASRSSSTKASSQMMSDHSNSKSSSASVTGSSSSVKQTSSASSSVAQDDDKRNISTVDPKIDSDKLAQNEFLAIKGNDPQETLAKNPGIKNQIQSESALTNIARENVSIGSLSGLTPQEAQILGFFQGWNDINANWYIIYVDQNGNRIPVKVDGMAYPTFSGELYYGDEDGSEVKDSVLQGLKYVENQGYQLGTVDLDYYLNQWNHSITVTLNFEQTERQHGGTVDVIYETEDGKILGTGNATYTNNMGETQSDPYIGDSYKTTAKKFDGYTLVQVPNNANGMVTANGQTVTYIYRINQESVSINFVDSQNHNKVVDTIQLSGDFGSDVSENVQDYVNQQLSNYVFKSTNWPGSLTLTTQNNGQVFTVYLTHKTKEVTETKVVTQTIKYVYQNGKKAAPDHVVKITFQRTNTIDLAAHNKVIASSQWENLSNMDDFPVVESPEIVGYTPSFAASRAVTGITADSPDDTQTITYTPNRYSMTLTFYDIDTGALVHPTVVLEGDYGTVAQYDYQKIIDQLVSQGYKVARDTIPTSGLKFDNTGNQAYEVDFTHTSTKLPADAPGLTKVVKRTIHYVYADGSQARPDVIQEVVYTRTAIEDNVTHKITYGAWESTDAQQFIAVDSPDIEGYTPSIKQVAAQSVTSSTSDQVVAVIYNKDQASQLPESATKTTVIQTIYYVKNDGTQLLQPTVTTITFVRHRNSDGTYSEWQAQGVDEFKAIQAPNIEGYTPNIQATKVIMNVKATDGNNVQTIIYTPIKAQATVTFYDETTKKTINVVSLSGDFGTSSAYSPSEEIQNLLSHGYIQDTANSDYPADGIAFETTDQGYTIAFKHATKQVSQTQTIDQQIKYQYVNGTTAAPSVDRSLTFTRTGVMDEVTGEVVYGDWIPETTDTFDAVKSPVITGYTTAHAYSDAVTVNGDSSNDIQIITYTPNQESATVTFTDQTTGQVIKKVTLTGAYDSQSTYSPTSDIQALEKQGYVLVNNGYHAFDFDKDSNDPIYNFVITMREGTSTTNETKKIDRTINYVNQQGAKIASPYTDSITFTRQKITNQVTHVVTYTDWTTDDATFDAVKSPTIKGYTVVSGQEEAPAITVNANSNNVVQTIHYAPNLETIKIEYIDAFDPNNPNTPNYNSNKILGTDTLIGYFGQTANYTPDEVDKEYMDKGYLPVGFDSSYPKNGLVFNVDGTQTYKYYFTHELKNISEEKTVESTIHYVMSDGTKAPSDNVQKVTFTRTNTEDMVTKQITNGQWNVSSQTTNAVVSPVITGYTPSQTTVAGIVLTPQMNDQTTTVTYTPNEEHFTVEFVDQTTGNTLTTVTQTGAFNTKTDYSPQEMINDYLKKGYVLVSNTFPSDGYTFSENAPEYVVTLKHGTTVIDANSGDKTLTKNVDRTINYQYANGKQAAQSVVQSVVFNRTAIRDNVTGKIISYGEWQAVGNDFYKVVNSPVITGYTPDQASVAQQTVQANDKNTTVTVTYNANQESATVIFKNDTTGQILDTVNLTGKYNEKSSYDPNSEIQKLINSGYVLSQDGYPTDGNIFNHDGVNQQFVIHFTEKMDNYDDQHNPEGLELKKTITHTIHYVYANGQKAAADKVETLTFNRTATKDEATGKITYSDWKVIGNSDDFDSVTSPEITGYHASANESTAYNNVKPGMSIPDQTITYTADQESATITFWDDTDNKALQVTPITGAYGSVSSYDPNSEIQKWVDKGYVMTENNVPESGIKFGENSKSYFIHFVHGTKEITSANNPDHLELNKTVDRTIQYQYQNGQSAHQDVVQTLTFDRTATMDMVTGKIIKYSAWTPATQSFGTVSSPVIAGYHADQTSVSALNNVTENTASTTVKVTYIADTEHAIVQYVDDTTGKVVQTDNLTGDYGTTSNYDIQDGLKKLNPGYVYVSTTYPSDGKIFNQSGVTPTYIVHVKEGTTNYDVHNNPENLTLSDTVTQTIHYQYQNGQKAADDVQNTLLFTRTAVKNNVTGVITYSEWAPVSQSFASVQSPTITGYTPNHAQSMVVAVEAGSADNEQTIIYTPNTEEATINFIDDTTGKVIKVQELTGTYGSKTDFDLQKALQDYVNQGYQVVSDGNYPTNGDIFGKDGIDQVFNVHLKETTTKYTPSDNPTHLELTDKVTQTIHFKYQNGQKAANDVTQEVTFERDAIKNNVTGAITYTDWTPVIQNFDQVKAPLINGYTPNHAQSDAVVVYPGDKDNEQTIVYTPNDEKATIKFVDDTTGKTLNVVNLTGSYGSVSDFDMTGALEQLKNHGYVIGKNTYPTNGDIFNQDGINQNFVVHVTEGTTKYTPIDNPDNLQLTDTVNQTIHYVYADGTKAADDVVKHVEFSRDAIKNNVTGEITYTDWIPASQNFAQVQSPIIDGYTADHQYSNSVVVKPGDQDNVQKIVYTPNIETATVKVIDATTGKILQTTQLTGDFGTKADFNLQDIINKYQEQGYIFVRSTYPSDGYRFTSDTPEFDIYFQHKTDTDGNHLVLTATVTETIKYQYQDGKPAQNDKVLTLHFHRTGSYDEVTHTATYGKWQADDGTQFESVLTPTITGYTPDKKQVAAVDGVSAQTPNKTIVVTYAPNQEHAMVTYVDETSHKIITTSNIDGAYGTHSTYDPSTTIKQLENMGYEVVDNDFPQNGIDFDQDGTVQKYTIGLKHKTITETATNNVDNLDLTDQVTETINYVYSDGHAAAKQYNAAVKYYRTAVKDLVTGQITYSDWQAESDPKLEAVVSPIIKGYTADKSVIDSIMTHEGMQLSPIMVTYSPNHESATVTFYDETSHKTIMVANLNGNYGTTSSYSPVEELKKLESQGYEIVDNDFPQNGIVFDQDGVTPNYAITLKHKTVELNSTDDPSLKKTVKQVINYQYEDGKTAFPTYTASVDYTRTALKDMVTGQIISYGNWTATGNTTLPKVQSPKIQGYTPNIDQVDAIQTSPDQVIDPITVVYKANNERVKVTYYDQTTGQIITSVDLNGAYGTHSSYDPMTMIKQLEDQGYELVSSDFPDNGVQFNEDGKVQNYTIELKHKTMTITPDQNPDDYDLKRTVSEVINYHYQDGSVAKPSHNAQITFTRNAIKDMVTGKIIDYTDWQANGSDTFVSVKSPLIEGYTANRNYIDAIKVTPDSQDQVINVVYTPDQEKATVTYYDDTTGRVLTTETLTGNYGTQTNYDINSVINSYQKQGYELVSNDYPKDGYTFSDTGNNNFVVHLKHHITTDTVESDPDHLNGLSKRVTRTILYKYADGTRAAKTRFQEVDFTRMATFDHVTGKITYGKWKVKGLDDFDEVDSPIIKGYLPDKSYVAEEDYISSNMPNEVVTVTYTSDIQKATIEYVDETTGKVLTTDTISGDLNTTSDYRTNVMIKHFEDQGYELVSDDYPTNGVIFDQNGVVKKYRVVLKQKVVEYTPTNNPENLQLTTETKRTIYFVDANGNQLSTPVVQVVHFTRHAIKNLVTNEITYTPWQTSEQFESIETPVIAGYDSQTKEVDSISDPNVEDQDLQVDVVYNKQQEAPSNSSNKDDATDQLTTGQVSENKTDKVENVSSSKTTEPTSIKVSGKVVLQKNNSENIASQSMNKNENGKLPQMGEQTHNGLLGLFLMMISGLLALFGFKKKKDE